MNNHIAYIISIIVIMLSACLMAFIPAPDTVKTLFSLPGIGGLFMLLVQGWRDQVAHERALELQSKQHDFDLAIASHMANVVFDKQVEFTEQYSQKLYEIVYKMFQEGPSEKGLSYAGELRDIRIKFSAWISKELNQKLAPYEAALREIGSFGTLEKITMDSHLLHSDYVNRMYAAFSKFLGISMEGIPREPENAADAVIEHLKDILNVFDLETLRRSAIRLAKEQG